MVPACLPAPPGSGRGLPRLQAGAASRAAAQACCWRASQTWVHAPNSQSTSITPPRAEKKDIDSFELADFELEGYAPHKAIKMQASKRPAACPGPLCAASAGRCGSRTRLTKTAPAETPWLPTPSMPAAFDSLAMPKVQNTSVRAAIGPF